MMVRNVLTDNFIDYLQRYDCIKKGLERCREKYYGFHSSYNLDDVPECDRFRFIKEKNAESDLLKKQCEEFESQYSIICESLADYVFRVRDYIKILSPDGVEL